MMGESMAEAGAASASGVRYQVNCSICGKSTQVPFEPMPGRPVYCKECLEKIKSGELQPLRSTRPAPAPAATDKYFSNLSELGIEFESRKNEGAKESRPVERSGFLGRRRPAETKPSRVSVDLSNIISETLEKELGEKDKDEE
ncbi:MAG: hypothetical protein HY456_02615 [Parcubacteria group bacterium]|nr:hypothetical protein [Parcubacteria group bacterium]